MTYIVVTARDRSIKLHGLLKLSAAESRSPAYVACFVTVSSVEERGYAAEPGESDKDRKSPIVNRQRLVAHWAMARGQMDATLIVRQRPDRTTDETPKTQESSVTMPRRLWGLSRSQLPPHDQQARERSSHAEPYALATVDPHRTPWLCHAWSQARAITPPPLLSRCPFVVAAWMP